MSSGFRDRVRAALADPHLQQALDQNADRRRVAWEAAFATLPDPVRARREARRVRESALDHLEELLDEFRQRLEENGVQVHIAADAEEACGHVVAIARERGVRRAAKSKSMVSEEIGLNAALQRAGIEVVETDLGEFVVQLRGEPPAHITAPAIHLRRQDVGQTFAERLGVPFTTDVGEMTATARAVLRTVFLESDLGISGVNFGVAETGTLCLVTNEGNGRLVTTLPPLHIALMGIERLVPTMADLARMLDVLPRAATGQSLTSYISLLQGPRRASDAEGPLERHVVLVDNGRLQVRRSPLAEALLCVRCGACLNACPVYREIGGHAYASPYPGPIGSVISPALFGMHAFGHLANASTLCGACREACPVDIDLPALLLRARDLHQRSVPQANPSRRQAMRAYAWVTACPRRYRWAQRLGALGSRWLPKTGGWIRWLPPPLNAWTRRRAFPPLSSIPFRARWKNLVGPPMPASRGQRAGVVTAPLMPTTVGQGSLPERFVNSAGRVGVDVIRTTRRGAREALGRLMEETGTRSLLVDESHTQDLGSLVDDLRERGIRIVGTSSLPEAKEPRTALLKSLDEIEAGLTDVEAALAETGSLVLLSGGNRSQLPSLLPKLHIGVVPGSRLQGSLLDWLGVGGEGSLRGKSYAVVVTGPSRTADIEMTLTVGVHGPARLIVLLIEDA